MYLDELLNETKKAYNENEIPVGALIVKNNEIIAIAHNTKETNKCCLNHAEINVIILASKYLNSWRLDECDMYITMEPCIMCYGAIIQSRIRNVYYLLNNTKYGFLGNNLKQKYLNTKFIKIDDEKYEKEILKMLKKFFSERR